MAKKRSSSRAWLKEHHDDIYVQKAQQEGNLDALKLPGKILQFITSPFRGEQE